MPHRGILEAERNQEVVERVFSSIVAGEIEDVRELLHPDLHWTPLPASGIGRFEGRDEAMKWLSHFGVGKGQINVEIQKIQTVWGWIVVLGTIHDRRDGGEGTVRAGWRLKVRDGLICEGYASEGWEDAIAGAQD